MFSVFLSFALFRFSLSIDRTHHRTYIFKKNHLALLPLLCSNPIQREAKNQKRSQVTSACLLRKQKSLIFSFSSFCFSFSASYIVFIQFNVKESINQALQTFAFLHDIRKAIIKNLKLPPEGVSKVIGRGGGGGGGGGGKMVVVMKTLIKLGMLLVMMAGNKGGLCGIKVRKGEDGGMKGSLSVELLKLL